jgi:hypothetical protein
LAKFAQKTPVTVVAIAFVFLNETTQARLNCRCPKYSQPLKLIAGVFTANFATEKSHSLKTKLQLNSRNPIRNER